MSQKLYVGGLPYSVTDSQLEEIFSAHGAVDSARVISDKFTGQSRGFGTGHNAVRTTSIFRYRLELNLQ